jgi:hypothetical protein
MERLLWQKTSVNCFIVGRRDYSSEVVSEKVEREI